MNSSRLIIIASYLFVTISVFKGQDLPFTPIGDKLGLPANECYNVMQDSKGYIWISTEAGLCRYNGSNCKIFDKKHGMPENGCYAVKEDKGGRIWILTSANRILNFYNDSLKEAPFSENYSSQLKNFIEQGYTLSFAGDSILINSQSTSYSARKNAKIVSLIFPNFKNAYNFLKTENGLIQLKSRANEAKTYEIAQVGFLNIIIKHKTDTHAISIPYKSNELTWRVLTASGTTGESFIGVSKTIIKVNPDLSYSYYHVPHSIISLYCDKDNGLWVGTIKGGVYYYKDTKTMVVNSNNLKGFSVSGVCVDHENGVWCSTLENGVFYCRNKEVYSYAGIKGLEKPTDLLKLEHGYLFISDGNNELTEIKRDQILRRRLSRDLNYPISDILYYKNKWVVCGKNFILISDPNFSHFKYLKHLNSPFNNGVTQLVSVNEARLFGIHSNCLLEVSNDKVIFFKFPLESQGKCLYYAGNNTLLYGCKDGLYKINILTKRKEKISSITGVVKIIGTSFGETWIITKENGLYKFSDTSAFNISKKVKIPTDRLFDITEDVFGTIWIASNNGLVKIKKANDKFVTMVYTSLNGLRTEKINKIATDSNNIYFSSTEGLFKFPLNIDLFNYDAPRIYITVLRLNGEIIPMDQPMIFKHDENSLIVEIDALTFKDINSPSVFYQLRGKNNLLNKNEIIKGGKIILDNLSPDIYELQIFALNADGVKSKQAKILNFEIKKPFWQTTVFIVLFALCIGVVLMLSVKWIINGVKKKEEEKTKTNKQLAEFQLTALQAQMNPHFIFNAINSIQGYILKQKEQDAYNYLAKFSKLIRIVLTNSQEKTLTLNQELEMLKLYIELEQLRFNESFDFKLTIDEKVNQFEMLIPAMLIQPYIENAIWHGLMNLPKGKNGTLLLDISTNVDQIKITVEDNGIGREGAKEFTKSYNHNSVGMKLTEQRLNIINALQNYECAKVLISDLRGETGKAIGTRVEIFIPVQYD